ncbi:MAG: TlpA family protein disulfide reductase [Tannerellaceae bacterium]|nr:TlpA family protein disulfide reductase [Tannerellaceae bacterium]
MTNLESIKSAVYHEQREVWQPGDTAAANIFCLIVNEYDNPADTCIGAACVTFDCEDSTRMEFGYDGNIRAVIYHDKNGIILDDFTTRTSPFRPVSPPFFNYTESIIKYILTTQDSIDWKMTDMKDHYYLKLTINEDRQVEFFGKAYHMPDNPYIYGNTTSVYELWISKSDDLPHKVRREMAHSISVNSRSKAEFNTLSIADFNMFAYLPADYEIRNYGDAGKRKAEPQLTGEKAPDWVLTDMDEKSVSLADFQGKAMLIQFTGIGCGPCMASIPFLKKLKDKYSADDFEVIAIETWIRRAASLRNYSNKHDLNYSMLNGTDKLIDDYKAGRAVPVFFIIDKQHNIRKVINGYSEKTTDEEILKALSELL